MMGHTSNSPTPLHVLGAAFGVFSSLTSPPLPCDGSDAAMDTHSGVSLSAGTWRIAQRLLIVARVRLVMLITPADYLRCST